jgi:lipopolysaccharide O-acetyltransferase
MTTDGADRSGVPFCYHQHDSFVRSSKMGAVRFHQHGRCFFQVWCSLSRIRRFRRENGNYLLLQLLGSKVTGFVRNYCLSKKLKVKKLNVGPRCFLRGLSSMHIGDDFSAETGLWLEAITRYNDQTFTPRITIGSHVRISQFVHIAATNSVEIGDDVLIGSRVIITDHNHGQYRRTHSSPLTSPASRPLDSDMQTTIGARVWLGDGVVVTPGAIIGEGSVIGANSVVIGQVPPFCLAVGAPAVVKKKFDFSTNQWSEAE